MLAVSLYYYLGHDIEEAAGKKVADLRLLEGLDGGLQMSVVS